MILLVDCGATKAVWCAADENRCWEVLMPGINFAHSSAEEMESRLQDAAKEFQRPVNQIWFYGAGLVSGKMEEDLQALLEDCFPGADAHCASDMVGAARAACGKRPGIAAILGTGANTCQWDGERIGRKVPSGGFIIGDEGSAAVLGRLFITDFLKDQVPAELAKAFREQFQWDYPTIVKNVYGSDAPARYLGSLAPFILQYYGKDQYVTDLVQANFRGFFERTILRYDRLPLGVVGGFGYACRDILTEMAREYDVPISTFLTSPMEGLLLYHGV